MLGNFFGEPQTVNLQQNSMTGRQRMVCRTVHEENVSYSAFVDSTPYLYKLVSFAPRAES